MGMWCAAVLSVLPGPSSPRLSLAGDHVLDRPQDQPGPHDHRSHLTVVTMAESSTTGLTPEPIRNLPIQVSGFECDHCPVSGPVPSSTARLTIITLQLRVQVGSTSSFKRRYFRELTAATDARGSPTQLEYDSLD